MLKLKELILDGYFGGLELGMSRETVENKIGAFDDWWDSGRDGIGRYGVMEFHFVDDQMSLIWCDNLSYLTAGKVDFDPWFLKIAGRKPVDNRFSFTKVSQKLVKAKVDFSVKHDEYNFVINITKSMAKLYFENVKETKRNKFYLVAVGKSIYDIVTK